MVAQNIWELKHFRAKIKQQCNLADWIMQLKVLTYNIKHGLGNSNRVDLTRILEVIKNSKADVIGLNEVDRYQPRSRFRNQASWLARKLKMEYRFTPGYRRFFGQAGNALLSRFPILRSESIPLTSFGEQRVALKISTHIGSAEVVIISTHLGLSPDERIIQIKELMDLIEKEETPVILIGDFNALPESQEVKIVANRLSDVMQGNSSQATFPSVNPNARIDYIFISENCVIINANIIGSEASDHLPVFAALEVQ